MKTGITHLPLHNGRAPAWLFSRMKLLAREIVLVILQEFGPGELLRSFSTGRSPLSGTRRGSASHTAAKTDTPIPWTASSMISPSIF